MRVWTLLASELPHHKQDRTRWAWVHRVSQSDKSQKVLQSTKQMPSSGLLARKTRPTTPDWQVGLLQQTRAIQAKASNSKLARRLGALLEITLWVVHYKILTDQVFTRLTITMLSHNELIQATKVGLACKELPFLTRFVETCIRMWQMWLTRTTSSLR